MDKNKIIALLLVSLLFFGFSYFNTQEQEKYQAKKAEYELQQAQERAAEEAKFAASQPKVTQGVESAVSAEQSAQAAREQSVAAVGESLTAAMAAEAQIITLENEQLKIAFSTRGAEPKSVTLKEYTKYAPKGERTELVEMFDMAKSSMALEFYIRNGLNNQLIRTLDYTFEAQPITKTADGGEQLTMSLRFDTGAELQYIYTLYNSESDARNYLLDFKIRMRDMTAIMANQSALKLNWVATSFQNERGFSNENLYTTLAYHYPAENSIEELSAGDGDQSEEVSFRIDWVAFKQQYFSSALIAPDGGISTATVRYRTAQPNSGYIKTFDAQLALPIDPQKSDYSMALYFGPNKYSTLVDVNELGYGDLRLQELVPLGWGIFGWVNKFIVIPLFDFLREYISNFGIIILILAVFVKLLISPMTYSSYISMAKMRVVKPQIDELSARYPKPEDAQKKQAATMDLYRKTGINPMGGCIPMLIQMPIVIAMFRFFPASIELRDQSFLWANDLSSYDSIVTLPFEIPFYGDHVSLFALLMAVVLYFYSAMNYNQSASSQPQQIAGMKFMMVYMMPVMMLVWFNSYSSGLCYYYFLANLLTIAQTVLIRRMVDDQKIQAILQANAAKSKNSKKSKFQQRYEEMMAQQEAQREAQQKGKK